MLAQYSDTWWTAPPQSRPAACTLVRVYPVDSNCLASLYADSCGTQKLPNPLRTNDRGVLAFWVDEGRYWIHIDGRTFPVTIGGSQTCSQQDMELTMADHVNAGDPHGDRAAASAALMHHEARTRNVHGICDTTLLETQEGAQVKANGAVDSAVMLTRQEIAEHACRTRNVHGIRDTAQLVTIDAVQVFAEDAARRAVEEALKGQDGDTGGAGDAGKGAETPEGAQAKADAARDAAIKAAEGALAEHAKATSGVHGADGDGELVNLEDVKPLVEEAARKAVEEALKDRPDGGEGEGQDGGAGGGAETPEGAQEKADAAKDAAVKAAAEDAQEKADAAKAAAIEYAKKCCEESNGSDGGAGEDGGQGDGGDAGKDGDLAKVFDAHLKACHTLKVVTEGVTPEEGWEVDAQELRIIGGVHMAFVRFKRTGDHLYSEDEKFEEEGLPSQGNVVPDLKIGTCSEPWRPAHTLLFEGSTSYGEGAVRVHPNGDIYLTTWTYNNPLRTDHLLRWTYTFLVEPDCGGEKTPEKPEEPKKPEGEGKAPEKEEKPAPKDGEKAPAPGGASPAELHKALAAYPSAFGENFEDVAMPAAGDWVELEPTVAVKLVVPPSRKVRVTTCMTARNETEELAQVYQAVEIRKGDHTLMQAHDRRALIVSFDRLREINAASHTLHIDFGKVAKGAAKAGDEVTFVVRNRTAVGEAMALCRSVAVESLVG